jgi:hypothetical protein
LFRVSDPMELRLPVTPETFLSVVHFGVDLDRLGAQGAGPPNQGDQIVSAKPDPRRPCPMLELILDAGKAPGYRLWRRLRLPFC